MPDLTPLSLKSVENFGSNAADADLLLKTCFERHHVFEGLLLGETYCVLGRKGVGKTAIYSKLLELNGGDTFSVGHSFQSYPWGYHQLQAESGVPSQLRFMASWRYLILITTASAVVERYKADSWSDSNEVFEAVAALEDFLVDSYGSTRPAFNTLFSPGKKLKFKGSIGSKNLAKLDIETIPMDQLPVHFTQVNATIQEALFTAASPLSTFYICFDELDFTFKPGDADYADQVVGLLLAARSIYLASRNRGLRVLPVVFLRDDVFASFDFEEKNKVFDDLRVLDWSDHGSSVTLRSMMESRFREVLGTDTHPTVSWDSVFDETQLTTGQQQKYTYILDRTLLRPRDVIKFCNEALSAYKASPGASGQIENAHVYAAKATYSTYLFKEFQDEVHKHIPKYQTAVAIIREIGFETFAPDLFVDIAQNKHKMSQVEAEDLLSQLFDFSMVAARRLGGAAAGSAWIWRYRSAEARFDPGTSQIRVHPGLKEALDLRQNRSPRTEPASSGAAD